MSSTGEELRWHTSSFGHGDADNVEIAELADGGTAMRDGKLGEASPVLRFTVGEWQAFLAGVRDGEFDV